MLEEDERRQWLDRTRELTASLKAGNQAISQETQLAQQRASREQAKTDALFAAETLRVARIYATEQQAASRVIAPVQAMAADAPTAAKAPAGKWHEVTVNISRKPGEAEDETLGRALLRARQLAISEALPEAPPPVALPAGTLAEPLARLQPEALVVEEKLVKREWKAGANGAPERLRVMLDARVVLRGIRTPDTCRVKLRLAKQEFAGGETTQVSVQVSAPAHV